MGNQAECPPGHVEYGSPALVDNAAELHHLANPNCPGIDTFSCGDHFHVGHRFASEGQRCKSDPEHVRMRRRIETGGRSE